MRPCESRRGAEQARLRMGDELDRHLVHPPLEPALGDKAVAKARARQVSGQAEA
jgi:hypothetical protein